MPEGPLDAKIVLVGRDFGFEEDRVGRPFVGPAGKLLNRALAKAGLAREDVLITNVVNKRPAGNKWEAHRAEDVDRGLVELADTLRRAPRQVVVALGAEAFQACTGHDPRERPELRFDGNGITELRGYVFDGPYGPVLASTHPAFILRTWLPWWPCLCWDLQKAKHWRGYAAGREIIVRCIEEVETREVNLLRGEDWLRPRGMLAVDIETAGPHAEEIKCVGFSWQAGEGICFEMNRVTKPFVVGLLANDEPKVFHNGQFDVTILERNGLTANNWTDDTMLLWHTLEPLIAGRSKDKNSQTQKSLRFLASIFTDEPFWKLYSFENDEEQLRLCARDARITWQLWHKLTAMLAQTGANPSSALPTPVMMNG